jgi:Ca-activated chloride channel homolog
MKKITAIVLAIVVLAIASGVAVKVRWPVPTVTVVHWTNGHLMRTGLMKEMSAQFNKEVHRTQSGKRIKIEIINHGSAEQSDDLISRIAHDIPLNSAVHDPTIVTPSSADWLVRANEAIGYNVVDLANSKSIAEALIGIVTYRDMAEALGWPEKKIGYADIIELRKDPLGWSKYPDSKAEWGIKPIMCYTDPITSTTGRSVLFGLYAIGADKSPEELVPSDVNDSAVVNYVKDFQTLIDHYIIGTVPLNTKIYQGPRYGHFFLMPEDNLIHLIQGDEEAIINGYPQKPGPITEPMVMIYPKEGSMMRNNIAGIVKASWVTDEQVEAADMWIDYLRADKQQRAFMQAGFRPVAGLKIDDPASKINGKYGLDPNPKTRILSPELIDPGVAAAIEASWVDVKRPAAVTFVLDTSASMSGTKIEQAKEGIIGAVDGMAKNNQVGLLSFSTVVGDIVPVAPLSQNRFTIADTLEKTTTTGNTALYDAIKDAIKMSDNAPGDQNMIRAVVVMTDGKANTGGTHLDDLVQMVTKSENSISEMRGFEGDFGIDIARSQIDRKEIIGSGSALKTNNPIQVFFIGIGEDTDIEVGRILAQATGAEFQGVAEKDLAKLIEAFSKYF